MNLAKVIVVLEGDGTFTLYNRPARQDDYYTIVSKIKDKETALLLKKVYMDGKYDGVAELPSKGGDDDEQGKRV